MNIGKAVAICENLGSEKYSLEEKALAIREVMNMPTHMSVKKDTLVGMIKWLWNFNLEISESHNGKRIVEIPTHHGRLIDADKFLAWLQEFYPNYTVIMSGVKNAKTIIEAEEEQ